MKIEKIQFHESFCPILETLKQQHGHKNEVNYWKLATKLRQLDSCYRLEKYRLFGWSVSVFISSSNWNYNFKTCCRLAGQVELLVF